jgi:uracil-DNA glycosylase
MPVQLRDAMAEVLEGWQADLPAAWSAALGPVQLGFDDIDPALTLEPWEPVFPPRRGRVFPGAPKGAHMLSAYDGFGPGDVRCVILGQDPYPEPGFATGRAFEAGNLASWHELDKMFSKSVRAYMQQIYAARTGEPDYARSFGDWPAVRAAITDPASGFEAPSGIGDRWVQQGVLLLNTALTLSRFQVSVDPHQSAGHLPLWRPLMLKTLETLLARGKPLVILAFGDSAADTLDRLGLEHGPDLFIARRAHPAFADRLFAEPNTFVLANQFLEAKGLAPIAW